MLAQLKPSMTRTTSRRPCSLLLSIATSALLPGCAGGMIRDAGLAAGKSAHEKPDLKAVADDPFPSAAEAGLLANPAQP